MVAVADAAADPRTVVVHLDYALVAYGAVVHSRRLWLLAAVAPAVLEKFTKLGGILFISKLKRERAIYPLLPLAEVVILYAQ